MEWNKSKKNITCVAYTSYNHSSIIKTQAAVTVIKTVFSSIKMLFTCI